MMLTIRDVRIDEEHVLVDHYRALWKSYGVDEKHISPDAEEIVRQFVSAGRDSRELAAFFAVQDGQIVGSVACEVQRLPYPDVTVSSFRKFGYIWSVYVVPSARRKGIASALVRHAVEHLGSIGCTKAVLHASDAGKGVYESAGFTVGPEMRLDLDSER